jgi:hypothetical protein
MLALLQRLSGGQARSARLVADDAGLAALVQTGDAWLR